MESAVQEPHFLFLLRRELERRRRKNPNYSLRAFALSLESNVGYLSRVFSGKRVPSFKRAGVLASKLALPARECTRFIESISDARKAQALNITLPKNTAMPPPPTKLNNDLYEHLSALHNLALLELTFVDDYQSDVRWMARQLALTTIEVRQAIERMKRLGLMEETDLGIRATNRDTTTANKNQTSAALKEQQREVLLRAVESLKSDPISERSMSGMTMAIDTHKLPLAKTLIQDFMEELANFLGDGSKTQVYQLGVSLYPLQRRRSKDVTCVHP